MPRITFDWSSPVASFVVVVSEMTHVIKLATSNFNKINLFTALFNLLSYLPTQACVPVGQELFTSCLVSIQCNSIESTKFPNIIVIRSCTLKLLKFSVPAYAKQIIFRLFLY